MSKIITEEVATLIIETIIKQRESLTTVVKRDLYSNYLYEIDRERVYRRLEDFESQIMSMYTLAERLGIIDYDEWHNLTAELIQRKMDMYTTWLLNDREEKRKNG